MNAGTAALATAVALALSACGASGSAAPAAPDQPSPTTTVSPLTTPVTTAVAAPVIPAAPSPEGATTVVPPEAPASAEVTTPYSAVPHRPAGLDQLPARRVIAPVRLRVDGYDIAGDVVPVSVNPAAKDLAVPPSPEVVAWYQHGPAPGEAGSSVLAAHVDFGGRPGPFFDLDSVVAGTTVVVSRADGSDITYIVDRVQQVAKPDLPRAEIFAREGPGRLVLVTCGGDFDRSSRHYDDNVVVYAEQV